jgi:hypothetical protein
MSDLWIFSRLATRDRGISTWLKATGDWWIPQACRGSSSTEQITWYRTALFALFYKKNSRSKKWTQFFLSFLYIPFCQNSRWSRACQEVLYRPKTEFVRGHQCLLWLISDKISSRYTTRRCLMLSQTRRMALCLSADESLEGGYVTMYVSECS